jgi:HNH endonuclease/AP2 domain
MKIPFIELNEKVLKRFWDKVEKTETCWNWKGAINPSGHGVIKIEGLNRGAHRVSYAIKNGELPEDLYICHKCHNPACVNPDHLYAGTPQQNCQDEVKRNNTRHYKCSNASKYNGVRWDKTRQNWISYVYIKRKLIDIGRHVSEVDAARNHDRIKYMRFGISENLNFPDEYNLK